MGHYVRQLLEALGAEGGDVAVRPFLSGLRGRPGDRAKASQGVAEMPVAPPRTGGLRDSWWVRRVLQAGYRTAFRFGARGYALYHEPNHIPIRCGLPTVTTIHDLSGLVHPEWHPADRVRWYEREFAAGVRQTRRFIAASEFTKRDMVERLNIPADRIDVTYQAPRPVFRRKDDATVGRLRSQLGLPESFLLFVGTLEPRKNVAGLLEAFAALPRELRRQVPLVLAGGWGWKMEALPELLRRHSIEANVRMLGYLGDDTLATLYTTCTALVWPTLYEGFGLPPLEAMACGSPVIVSNVTSLPEVVGNAGVLLDPHDVPAWTEAMRRMADDDDWRGQWRQRSRDRATTFSWQRCARQTLDCYRRALQA